MVRNRWYPTNTTLSNGDVLTTSGETEPGEVLANNLRYPERWHNGFWTSLTSAPKILPTYPWMFQAPNGHVFYAGPGPYVKYLDPTGTGTWTEMGNYGRTYNRGQGTAAMFWPGKILVVGGSDGQTVTNTTEVIDLTSGAVGAGGYQQPVITAAASMRHARHHVNSTILPDGTVLVTGGSRITSSNDPNQGELEAEIWTPPAPDATGAPGPGPGTWTTVAPMKEARMYHSTAVLLPDGRVLSAGGEEVIDYNPFRPNVNNHCTAEIYSPPYLFKGPRPVISYAPPTTSYGQDFTIDTPTPATVDAISWVRLSSVTHSFNMNQRYQRFPVVARTATSVTAAGPANANDCPPGHYLVFALSNGVPSEGKIVSISENPCLASVSLATSVNASTCNAVAEAVAYGTNISAGYHWYIDGVYQPAYDGQPSVAVNLDSCRPQVTFAVEVTPSCGGYVLIDSRSVSVGPFHQNGQVCLCE